MFPTPVGMNRRRSTSQRRFTCVPHARGDEPRSQPILTPAASAFPTPVGMNRMGAVWHWMGMRVPHARGDEPSAEFLSDPERSRAHGRQPRSRRIDCARCFPCRHCRPAGLARELTFVATEAVRIRCREGDRPAFLERGEVRRAARAEPASRSTGSMPDRGRCVAARCRCRRRWGRGRS